MTMKRKRERNMFPHGNTFPCKEFLTTQHTVESEVHFSQIDAFVHTNLSTFTQHELCPGQKLRL